MLLHIKASHLDTGNLFIYNIVNEFNEINATELKYPRLDNLFIHLSKHEYDEMTLTIGNDESKI